jgi:hypothetical protein
MTTHGTIDNRTSVCNRALKPICAAMLALAAWGAEPARAAPTLAYATYLGGTSDDADVFGNGVVDVAVDRFGNVYVARTTRSADFPTTPEVDDTLDGDLEHREGDGGGPQRADSGRHGHDHDDRSPADDRPALRRRGRIDL